MNNNSGANTSFINHPFYVDDMFIDPLKNQIFDGKRWLDIQPKVMEVLCYLSLRANELVTADELITICWSNTLVSDGPIHKCIAQLRKVLRDSSKEPRFIKTIVKKGYVLIASVRGVHETSATGKRWLKGNPYPGNAPYSQTHCDVFFGREQLIATVEEWLAELDASNTSWLAIESKPGAGKTSLIHAGILPRLSALPQFNATSWVETILIDLNNVDSIAAFKEHCLDPLIEKGIVKTAKRDQFGLDIVICDKVSSLQGLLQGKQSQYVAIVVDHLDKVFKNKTLEPLIVSLINCLLSSQRYLLITALDERRHHYLCHLIEQYDTAQLLRLPELSTSELTDIIQQPVTLAGFDFEFNHISRERLDHKIIREFQLNPLPVSCLQLLMHRLFNMSHQQFIEYSAYEKINGFKGCLIDTVEDAFSSLNEADQNKFYRLLYSLLKINAEGQIETQVVNLSCLKTLNCYSENTIELCINSGMLKSTIENNDTFIYFVHDCLITDWPVISQWINEHIKYLYIYQDLRIFTGRWLYHNKHPQYLVPSLKKLKKLNEIIESGDFIISHEDKSLAVASKKKLKKLSHRKSLLMATLTVAFMTVTGLAIQLNKKNNELLAIRGSAENLISFILYDLKEKLEPLGKLELLDLVAQKTLDYFKLDGASSLTDDNLLRWVSALHLLGQVDISKHHYKQAKQYFTRTISALETELDRNQSEKALELYMLANYWLGYIHYLEAEYMKAKTFWLRYKEIADTLFRHYSANQWQLEISNSLNNLGALAEIENELVQASSYFEQSYEIKRKLLVSQPNNLSLRQDLADTRSWQSNLEAKAGHLKKAITLSQEALKEVTVIAEISADKTAQHQISELNHSLALLWLDNGELHKALEHVQATQTTLTELISHDPQNKDYITLLVWSYLLQSRTFIILGNYDKALIAMDSAQALLHETNRNKTAITEIGEALTLLNIYRGQAFYQLRQHLTAQRFITLAESTLKEHFDNSPPLTLLANLYLTKAITQQPHDKSSETLEFIKSKLASEIKIRQPNYKLIYFYLVTLKMLGELSVEDEFLKLYENSDFKNNRYLDVRLP
ncbi:MAG TPA: hypothetical protein DG048_15915 [Pseudoalteromonas sp.]|nr:hypothetical protein [Pseudoalteromonas sp.]